MKNRKQYKLIKITQIIFVVILISCSNSKSKTQETKNIKKAKQKISKKIEIKSDLFEIISPDIYTNKSYNLFVNIDSHGNGKLAVSKLKDLKNENCIIIGLNNVKNNTPHFIEKIDQAISVSKQNNVKIKHLYISGFSGGARMALQYAIQNPSVSGVISCGAGSQKLFQTPINFYLVLISGTKDFNFIEQYYSPFSSTVWNQNILSIHFKGNHSWPDDEIMNQAAKFLLVKTGELETELFTISDDNLNVLLEKADYLSFSVLEKTYKMNPNQQNKANLLQLLSLPKFKKNIYDFEQKLNDEFKRNNALTQNLPVKSFDWWKKKIDFIEKKSKENSLEGDSYARTKAYLGVMMFSVVNREINNPNSTQIRKYLKIYEYLEPENKDMKRFKQKFNNN